MQENQAWIALFRRIPAALHEALALGLATGAEIVLQKIVKLEPDFMIIRGRLAGTQDSGRIVMVPYNKLTFVAIPKFLPDSEVEAIFGKGAPAALADIPSPAFEEATPGSEVPSETADSQTAPAETPPARKKPEQASKTVLLAKLRDRLKEK